MTERDEIRVTKALQGLSFPATKSQLLDYASSRDVGTKTLRALSVLEDREYADKDDVARALPRHRTWSVPSASGSAEGAGRHRRWSPE